tara:strand:+ start:3500 stop:3739 length:240 start_codon:yes stop_codon:yes gene_type:complete
MGFTSIWHWLVVLVIVLVLFGGKGKIASIMGDLGKGLKNFKKSINNNEEHSDTENMEEIELIEAKNIKMNKDDRIKQKS